MKLVIKINEYTQTVLEKIKDNNDDNIKFLRDIKEVIRRNMNKNLVKNIFTTKIFQK